MPSETALRAWLNELLSEVEIVLDDRKASAQPQDGPCDPADPTNQQPGKAWEDTQSIMDTLLVCIKYMAFDIEATHRDNRRLRKMLEQCRNHDEEA